MNMKTLQRFTGWNRLFLSLLLMASLLAPARMMGQEELTVHDSYGSSSDVPIHGEYCNYYLKAEFVIPATDLAVMDGASIINLKFYASQSFVLWGDANFCVFLKEVDDTKVSSFTGMEDATIVFEGPLSVVDYQMEVPFTTNFEYHGGNLLLGFYNTAKGTSSYVSWKGRSVSYTSATYGWGNSSLAGITSGGLQSFIPKTTFTYVNLGDCPKPIYVSTDVLGNRKAQLSWTQFGAVGSWQGVCTTDPDLDPNLANSFEILSNPVELNNLTPSTTYYVYLRSVCGNDQYSEWSDVYSFTTLPSCIAPTHLAMTDMTTLSWTAGDEDQANWDIFYTNDAEVVPDGTTQATLTHTGAPTVTLSGLDESQTYYAYVRANCGDGDVSAWSNVVSFNPSSAPQLTVHDGTVSNNVMPINGNAGMGYTNTEFVIRAEELSAMNDSYISEIVFYGQGDTYSWQNRRYQVFMKEIAGTTLSTFVGYDETDVVYSGKMDYSYYDDIMTVKLDKPYHYNGGNLLVGFYTLGTTSSYNTSTVNWEGETVIGASLYGYKSSSGSTFTCVQQNFSPKTTFTFSGMLSPSSIHASYIGMHTASLNWTPNSSYIGTTTGWELVYSPVAGFAPNTVSPVVINGGTNTSCDLANLTPNTIYYVYVRAKNGDAFSPWSECYAFLTAEYNPILLNDDNPYYYDGFDEETLAWSMANGGNHWMQGRSTCVSAPYAMYLSASHSFIIDMSIATKSYVFKTFELEGGKQYEVSFDWRCKPLHNSTDFFDFHIYPAGVIFEGGEYPIGASAILSSNLEGSSKYSWYDHYETFQIPEGEGGSYVVAFSWKSDQYGSGGYYYDNSAAFDNFLFNVYQGEAPRPTPPQPEPTEVTLPMEELEVEPTAWQIIYSTDPELDPYTLDLSEFPDNLPEGVLGVETTDAVPALQGLDPETGYYVYVRAIYPPIKKDEEERVFSRWSEQITFTTAVSCFPVEDLEATTVTADNATLAWNTGDQQSSANAPATWNVRYKKDVQAGATTTYTFNDGKNPAAYVENWSVKNGILISAGYTENNCIGFEVQLPCVVSFDAEGISANVNYEVKACNDPQGYSVMASMNGTAVDGVSQPATFDFSDYEGTCYLVFSMSFQAPLLIDNLTLDVPVWTTGTANGNTFTLNDLESKTDYLFAVQAHCGEGDDSQWVPASFRTAYGNLAIPYEEDFDSYSMGDLPEGWTSIMVDEYPAIYDAFYSSPDNALLFYSGSDDEQYAILPPAENLSSLQMVFWSASPGSQTTFTIGVMTDPEDATTFEPVKSFTTTSNWTKNVVYFTQYEGQGQYIAIQLVGVAGTEKYFAIDDVEVLEAPSCFLPEALDVTDVNTSSAVVSWTPNGEETQWNLSIRDLSALGASVVVGFEDGVMPADWLYENMDVVEDASDAYEGDWCLKPTASRGALIIPVVFGSSVSFYVKAMEEETDYNVMLNTGGENWQVLYSGTATTSYELQTMDLSLYSGTGMIGFDVSEGIVMDNITLPGEPDWGQPILVENTPSYSFDNLSLGTSYEVRVQAVCAVDDVSDWVETQFNTSLCEPENQCAITYTLEDDYGDGWNGASINIISGSTLVASLTIDNGRTDEGSLSLCPGLTYTFAWTQGEYDGECSFTIYDAEGTVLLQHDVWSEFEETTLLQYEMVCPSCITPSGLAVTEHSPSSVAFSWMASAGASVWEYAYSSDNEHWSQTQVVVGTPSCIIEELRPSSSYYFRVRANCGEGDYSKWATLEFDTDCGTINVDAEHPYSENFDAIKGWGYYDNAEHNILPHCWDYLNTSENYYDMGYPSLFGEHSYYYSEGGEGGGRDYEVGECVRSYSCPTYLRFAANNGACEQYAILPAMSNVNGLQLKFMVHRADFDIYIENVLHIGVMTDPNDASTYTEIQSYLLSIPVYEELCVYFNKYELQPNVNEYYIAFKVDVPEGEIYDIYIDDVSVSVLPSCLAPYELSVDNVGENDATLTWAPNGDETAWQVRYSSDEVNWTIVDYTEAEPGQTVTEVLDNLAHNTLYYVQVRANCGGSYSDWSRQNKFRTACSSGYQDVPYFEDFDSYIAFDDRMPQCWDYINTSNSTQYPTNQSYPVISNGVDGYTANCYMYFLIQYYDYLNHHYDMDPQDQYVILPRMENIGNLQMKFSGLGEKNNYWTDYNCQVKVGVFDDNNAFHLIRTVETSRTGYYGNYLVTFDGYEGSGRIAFLVEPPQQFGGRCYSSLVKIDNVSVTPKVSYKKFIADGNWSDASCWENGEMPTSASDDVLIRAAAVIPSDCAAVCGTIEFDGNGASITIEDGGQLRHSNRGVHATMKKHIDPYTEGERDQWNLIAMPVVDEVYFYDVENINSGAYDLYYFDQKYEGAEWRNQKDYETGWYNLIPKKGYLYANADEVTLEVDGELFPANADQSVSLDYVEGMSRTGWNLIGNPFACQAYLANGMAYYRMNAGGTAIESAMAGTAIAPMEGVFVKASGSGQTAVFTTTQQRGDGHLNIRLSHNQGRAIDNAIIGFGEGGSLLKVQLMSNASKIYFTENDKDYAIISVGQIGEQPLNFTTSVNGSYTLTFSLAEVRLSYLHLIDNMTGADVDLLETPTYTFSAKSTDYESRFKLVFATIGDADADDDFAFFSNGNWVVVNEGEAVVQVIDMNGRILSSETINGSAQVNVNAACGLYVMRLVNGEKVKVQKIVVQ